MRKGKSYAEDYKHFRNRTYRVNRQTRRPYPIIAVNYITHHRETKMSIPRGNHDLIESMRELEDKSQGVQCKVKHEREHTILCFTNVVHSKHQEILFYINLLARHEVKVRVT